MNGLHPILTYIPVAVLTAVITGFAGIALAFVKVIPKLKELSTTRLEEAVGAWQSIAKRHEARIKALEDDCSGLRKELHACENICRDEAAARRDADIAHAAQIEALHKEFREALQTAKELLGGKA